MSKISALTPKTTLTGTEVTVLADAGNNVKATVDAFVARVVASGDVAEAVHTHAISDTTGLQTALDGKAATSHSHAISDTTGLQTALDGKAATSHSHAASDITGLTATAAELNILDGALLTVTELNYVDGVTSAIQTQLDGKSATGHTHAASDISGLTADVAELNILDGATLTTTELNYVDGVTSAIQTQLNAKAASSHTHAIADTTGLQTALDGKAASSHNHAASEITSGTIATARLGSGSAAAGTILRGDQSWSLDTRAFIFMFDGLPEASETTPPFKMPFAGTIRTASAGNGSSRVAATSSTVWTLYKSSSPGGATTAIGTLTFTSGSSTPSLATTGGVDQALTTSDYISSDWPAQDATLSDVTCVVIVERTA